VWTRPIWRWTLFIPVIVSVQWSSTNNPSRDDPRMFRALSTQLKPYIVCVFAVIGLYRRPTCAVLAVARNGALFCFDVAFFFIVPLWTTTVSALLLPGTDQRTLDPSSCPRSTLRPAWRGWSDSYWPRTWRRATVGPYS
jgi:hypothetical protein